jgi:hypothetical protein
MGVKYEVNAQFDIIEIVEDNKRRARNGIHTKSMIPIRLLGCWVRSKESLDGRIDAVALVGDDTNTKPFDTLSEQRIELLKCSLRQPNGPHRREGTTPRFTRNSSVMARA